MNILLIESQNLYRHGLMCLLDGFADDLAVDGVSCIEESLLIIDEIEYDLIVFSSRCLISDCLDGISRLVEKAPLVPIFLLPVADDLQHLQLTLKLGVKGIILHNSTQEELLAAFRLVCAGGIYIPRELILGADILDMKNARKSANNCAGDGKKVDLSKLELLSDRQTEVLQNLIQGSANKVISAKMNISENTVKTHLSTIFKLLEVRNRTEAVYFANQAYSQGHEPSVLGNDSSL